jgi:hypothetical protein
LFKYVDFALAKYVDTPLSQYSEYYQHTANMVINTFISFELPAKLLLIIMQKFYSHNLDSYFFEALDNAVICDRITLLPYAILDKMFLYFINSLQLKRLDALITYLDPDSVNCEFFLKVCQDNDLLNASIHLYNDSFNDYLKPLEHLVGRLLVKSSTDAQNDYSYTMFVYIAYCISGYKFPVGLIYEENIRKSVREIFLTLILSPSKSLLLNACKLDNLPNLNQTWPFFRFALSLDCFEFLKVLGAVLEHLNETDLSVIFFQECRKTITLLGNDECRNLWELTVYILLTIKEDSEWDTIQIDAFNTFIGRMLDKYPIIKLPKLIVKQILDELISSSNTSSKNEREFAYLCILSTGYMADSNENDVVIMFSIYENANFLRVCEKEAMRLKMFQYYLNSFLHDAARFGGFFTSFDSYINMEDIKNHIPLKAILLNSIDLLVDKNVRDTCLLFNRYWPTAQKDVLKAFISPLFRFRYLEVLLETNDDLLLPEFYSDFLNLKCQFQPATLKETLLKFTSMSAFHFDLHEVEQLSKKYFIHDVTIWLYQQKGDHRHALQLTLTQFKENAILYKNNLSNIENVEFWLDFAVECCEKAELQVSIVDFRKLWIELLTKVCFSEIFDPGHPIWESAFQTVTQHLDVCVILEALVEKEGDKQLGKYKKCIISLLAQNSEESVSLEISLDLAKRGLELDQESHFSASNIAFTADFQQCELCKRSLISEITDSEFNKNIVVCSCRHAFHESCLVDGLYLLLSHSVNPKQSGSLFCVVCGLDPSSLRRMQKGKKGQYRKGLVINKI